MEEVVVDQVEATGGETTVEPEATGEAEDLEEAEDMDHQHTLGSLDTINSNTNHVIQVYNN